MNPGSIDFVDGALDLVFFVSGEPERAIKEYCKALAMALVVSIVSYLDLLAGCDPHCQPVQLPLTIPLPLTHCLVFWMLLPSLICTFFIMVSIGWGSEPVVLHNLANSFEDSRSAHLVLAHGAEQTVEHSVSGEVLVVDISISDQLPDTILKYNPFLSALRHLGDVFLLFQAHFIKDVT